MPRLVLFDAGSRAAASAAATLADEYDVQPWAADGGAEGVVLTGAGGAEAAAERTRLIGIVDAAAPGPWPATWYGLVPAAAARPLLARAGANRLAVPDQPLVRRALPLSNEVDAGGADAHAPGRDAGRPAAHQLQARGPRAAALTRGGGAARARVRRAARTAGRLAGVAGGGRARQPAAVREHQPALRGLREGVGD